MGSAGTETCSVSSARIEALESEIRQLRATIDDMPRRIGAVLLQIGGALVGEIPQARSAEACLPTATDRDADQAVDSVATTTMELVAASIEVNATNVEAPEQLSDERIPAALHCVNAPQESTIGTAVHAVEITPADSPLVDAPVRTDGASSFATIDASNVPSNVVVLDKQEKRRIIRRASYAAAVALIAALSALVAARSGGTDSEAEIAKSSTAETSFTDSDWRTRSVKEEFSRLRARLGF